MSKDFKTLFDNRPSTACKLSILIPVRNDNRIFKLLDALKLQILPCVHICILNDLKPTPLLQNLPDPIQGIIFHSSNDMTIAEKANALLANATGEWVVYIESDTIPHKEWLEDILTICASENPLAIHQGGEIFVKSRNFNNFLFRRDLSVPAFTDAIKYAQDTAWFMNCDKSGLLIVPHIMQALIFHDARKPEGDMRFLGFAHDFSLIAAQTHDGAFFWRKFLAEAFYLIRGAVSLLALVLYYTFFRLKYLFISK